MKGLNDSSNKVNNLNNYFSINDSISIMEQKNMCKIEKKIDNKNSNNNTIHDWRRSIVFTNNNISKVDNNIISDSTQIKIEKNENTETKRKLGIAFVYNTMLSNGISRFLQITGKALVETERYDVYFITSKMCSKDLKFHKDIKRFIGNNNITIIRNISKHYKIEFFILNNSRGKSTVNFYRSFGAKVICIFHGNYISSLFMNSIHTYRKAKLFDHFDAFVFICSDDFYFL